MRLIDPLTRRELGPIVAPTRPHEAGRWQTESDPATGLPLRMWWVPCDCGCRTNATPTLTNDPEPVR